MIEITPDAALVVAERRLTEETDQDSRRWTAAVNSMGFRRLLRSKIRLVAPLLGTCFVFVICMTLMAGFARDLMSMKVVGAFNVGYLMVLVTYLLCWLVAVIYVSVANRKFETQAESVIADFAARNHP